MKQALYKFSRYFKEFGIIEGTFIATAEEIKELIGKEISIYDTLKVIVQEKDVILISDDQKLVDIILQYSLCNGFNPLFCVEEHDENGD